MLKKTWNCHLEKTILVSLRIMYNDSWNWRKRIGLVPSPLFCEIKTVQEPQTGHARFKNNFLTVFKRKCMKSFSIMEIKLFLASKTMRTVYFRWKDYLMALLCKFEKRKNLDDGLLKKKIWPLKLFEWEWKKALELWSWFATERKRECLNH